MPILDGEFVDAHEIDATKHTFIGTFRAPQPPGANGAYAVACNCGASLWDVQSTRQHWLNGCFDVMQYKTIEVKK